MVVLCRTASLLLRVFTVPCCHLVSKTETQIIKNGSFCRLGCDHLLRLNTAGKLTWMILSGGDKKRK